MKRKKQFLSIIFLFFLLYFSTKYLKFFYPNEINTIDLNNTIRLLCLVKTHPANFKKRLKSSFENCIKHCTDYRYIAIKTNQSDIPYKLLHPTNWDTEDYAKLTDKVYNSLIAIQNLTDFDWYLLADDDTFINMNNLYKFLSDKKPEIPIQYGHHYGVKGGFLSGGAGFVFSNIAFKQITNSLASNSSFCPNTGIDDLDLSKCLLSINATIGDSRDELGLERFHPGSFKKHYYGKVDKEFPFHQQFNGKKCCAKSWISFHDKNYRNFVRMIRHVNNAF